MEHDQPEGGDPQVYDWYAQGNALLEAGDLRGAAEIFELAVAAAPDKASLHEALGRTYFAASRIRPAAAAFARAIELDPSNAYAHFALGRAHERSGDLTGATKHYKIAAALADRADYRAALERVQRRLDR